jgi:hypothetical protein
LVVIWLFLPVIMKQSSVAGGRRGGVKISRGLAAVTGWGPLPRTSGRLMALRAGMVPGGTGCAGTEAVVRMGVAVR